jgi:predicted CoA-binding protein
MSHKPIFQKLLIKDNYRVLLVNEPEGYRSILGKLPKNVTIFSQGAKSVDLIQVFMTSKKELEDQLVKARALKAHQA